MKIHKEGYSTILFIFTLLLLINFLLYNLFVSNTICFIAISLSALIFLFILFFFRYNFIDINTDSCNILSPADGKVVAIEEVFVNEFLQERRIQVSIFMSPLNVHLNRSPINGVIKNVKYHPGKNLVAWHPKSSTDNERTSILIEDSVNNFSVLVRQIAGALARRIVYYTKEGDTIKQGSEIGFIKFGSRVDLLLPLETDILVQLEEKVKCGITCIGQFRNQN